MLFRHFCFLIFILFTTVSFAQNSKNSVSATVINIQDGQPIPYLTLGWKSGVQTMTNADGYFTLFSQEGVDSIIVVEDILYQSYSVHVEKVDSTIALVPIEIKTGRAVEARAILDKALQHIGDNYYANTHILKGNYQEILSQENKIIQYGEGQVKSLKSGYVSNPDFDKIYDNQQSETSALINGYQKNLTNTEHEIPISSRAKYLAKAYDPLSSPYSPLLQDNISRMQTKVIGQLNRANETLHIIHFELDGINENVEGRIIIGGESSAIYMIEMQEEMGHPLQDSIQWSGMTERWTRTMYRRDSSGMVLSSMQVREHTIIDPELPEYINEYYYIVNTVEEADKTDNKASWYKEDQEVNAYLPIQENKYLAANSMVRQQQVVALIGEGESINYKSSDLEDLIIESQNEKKLIFVYVYENNDAPSQRMMNSTLKHQELVHTLNKNFVCGNVNLSKYADHDIIYAGNLQYVPSIVIMTPLGQVLEVKDGYILPVILKSILASYENLDIDRLFYAYDTRKGSDKKKLQSAYIDLYLQLYDLRHPQLENFQEIFLEKYDDWKSPTGKNIAFDQFMGKGFSDFDKMLKKYQDYYLAEFGKEEYLDKLVTLAEQEVIYRDIDDPEKFKDYVEDIVSDEVVDSLYNAYLMKYYSMIVPDQEKYLVSALTYCKKYYENNWETCKLHMLTLAFFVKPGIMLEESIRTLALFEDQSIPYEYLDIKSVMLDRQGKKEEALGLIAKIKKSALENGLNYKIALNKLAEINKD